MPMGAVGLLEIADAIVARLQDRVEDMDAPGAVKITDSEDVEEMRKDMYAGASSIRISFPKTPLSAEPGMNRVMIYQFGLVVTVLYRNIGNQFTRWKDGPAPRLSEIVKQVYAALQGETLGILNQGGLTCGSAEIVPGGDALQAMQFTVTARSREMRS